MNIQEEIAKKAFVDALKKCNSLNQSSDDCGAKMSVVG